MKLPYKKTWWVEPGKFLAGCFPGSTDPEVTKVRLRSLLQCGIRGLICLQEEDETNSNEEPFPLYRPMITTISEQLNCQISSIRVPIRDMDTPNILTMSTILSIINSFIDRGLPVYIHCWGGHGRTGTVVGCWLVQEKGLSGVEALQRIKELRVHDDYLRDQISPQTLPQEEMVKNWKQVY